MRERIDWDNLPPIAFRRSKARDVEALSRLKARRVKKKPGKAHATKADIARLAQAKATRRRLKLESISLRVRAIKEATRAYWRGESDVHP